MGHNKLYRNFIILQEDSEYSKEKDYSNKVSGYAKIEVKADKCKVSFYVQNLMNSEKYYMLLICYKKDNRKIINLGPFDVAESGKAEITNEYYINSIGGLNFSFEEISGACVCKKESESLKYILYGFCNGETIDSNWKKCKVYNHDEDKEKYLKENLAVENKKEKHKDICKDDDHKDYKHKEKHKDHDDGKEDDHKNYDDCKDDDKEHKDHHDHDDHAQYQDKKDKEDCKGKDDYDEKDHQKKDSADLKESISKCPMSNAQCEDYLKCNRELKRNKFDEYESQIENEKQEKQKLNPYDFDMNGKLGKFFEGVVKDFTEIKNKINEIKFCKWYKADVTSIDEMCDTSDYNKYTIAYYPMINYYPYIRKYGYFMMGYKCDENGNLKYIIYGVPGTKNKDNQPYGGKTGFVTWMKKDNQDMGLWLMFYDYKKSMVVIPKNE